MTDSLHALTESARALSLAKAPTAQQMHDVCARCVQMAADYFGGTVTMTIVGLRVVREPTPKMAKMIA